jgi:hypothetical protein
VYQTEIYVRVAARNVFKAIHEHRVPGYVEPVEVLGVPAEVEQMPVDRYEQLVDRLVLACLAGIAVSVSVVSRLRASSESQVSRGCRRAVGDPCSAVTCSSAATQRP